MNENGRKRVPVGEYYYTVMDDKSVQRVKETGCEFDARKFSEGNYHLSQSDALRAVGLLKSRSPHASSRGVPMIEQRQVWKGDCVRHLIACRHGSVQLDLFFKPKDDGTTAYIHGLWTVQGVRRRGIGKDLLRRAEAIAKQADHKSVTLFWDEGSTPVWVYEWYLRDGYEMFRTNQQGWRFLRKNL